MRLLGKRYGVRGKPLLAVQSTTSPGPSIHSVPNARIWSNPILHSMRYRLDALKLKDGRLVAWEKGKCASHRNSRHCSPTAFKPESIHTLESTRRSAASRRVITDQAQPQIRIALAGTLSLYLYSALCSCSAGPVVSSPPWMDNVDRHGLC